MKHNAIIGFSFLFFSLSASSQMDRLRIGDKVPDIEFKLINKGTKAVRLSSYKDKLVILDFWATWCSSCISSFSKADSLQKNYGDKIQVLLVNSKNRGRPDSKEKVNFFYERWLKRFPDFNLPIAVEDSIAFSLFPSTSIPHYVWITPDGKVAAITGKKNVTAENINKFLSGSIPNLPIKDDSLKKVHRLRECTIRGTINKEISYERLYLSIAGKVVDSAIVNNGKFEFKREINRGAVAILQSEVKMNNGKMVMKEAVCYLTPGKINITLNALGKDNPLYSFIIEGTLLATDYENKLRKPVFELNHIISNSKKDLKNALEANQKTSLIETQILALQKKCFDVPRTFIKENPSSELCIIALKMMGKGDPTIPNGKEELKTLFDLLDENLRISEEGKEYLKSLNKLL